MPSPRLRAGLARSAILAFTLLLPTATLPMAPAPARADGPSLDHLPCSPLNGCSDPEGILIFDEGALSGQVSGLRDDNSSQQCGQGVTCIGVGADDGSDFVNFAAEWDGGAGRERYAQIAMDVPAGSLGLPVEDSPEVDRMFCRFQGDGAPARFDACSEDDEQGNTCASTLGGDGRSARNLVVRIDDPAACAPGPAPCWEYAIAIRYVGCNEAGPGGLSLLAGVRRAVPAGSRIGAYDYDELHHSGEAASWTVDALVSRPLDVEFTPRVNLLENGYAEQDCADGAHGWVAGGAGSKPVLQALAYTPHRGPWGAGVEASAFRGHACGAAFTDPNDDSWIETAPFPVEPDRVYAANLMLNVYSFLEEVRVEALDAATDAPLPGGRVWNCRGRCLEQGPGYRMRDHQAVGWTRIHVKFRAPSDVGSAKLRFRATATGYGLTQVAVDEAVVFPAVYQDLKLNEGTLLSHLGTLRRIYCVGDSRTDEQEDMIVGVNELCAGLDSFSQHDGIGLNRLALLPNQKWTIFERSSSACGGYQAAWFLDGRGQGPCLKDVMTPLAFVRPGSEYDPCGTGPECVPPDLVIVKFGHNDIAIGPPGHPSYGACARFDPPPEWSHVFAAGTYCQQTPELLLTSIQRICALARAVNARCLVLTETQFRGNSDPRETEALWGPGFAGLCDDDGTGGGRGDNCAAVFQRFNALVTRGPGADGGGGIGW